MTEEPSGLFSLSGGTAMLTDVVIISALFFTLAAGLVASVLILERTGW